MLAGIFRLYASNVNSQIFILGSSMLNKKKTFFGILLSQLIRLQPDTMESSMFVDFMGIFTHLFTSQGTFNKAINGLTL